MVELIDFARMIVGLTIVFVTCVLAPYYIYIKQLEKKDNDSRR